MTFSICETCGTQFAASAVPPAQCPICEDERQYVGWEGQTWTTHEALAAKYRQRLEDDAGLLGIGMTPGFAINQERSPADRRRQPPLGMHQPGHR